MKLENFMIEHGDELFEVAPSATHRSVMEAKLERRRGGRTVRRWVVSVSAAAAVVALALMVLTPSVDGELEATNATQSELSELDRYYQQQRQQSILTIEQLIANKDAATQIEIRGQVTIIENEITEDKLPQMLLTIDAEQYLALTVQRYEVQNENLQTLINILNR